MQTKFHLPRPYVARLTAALVGGRVFINGDKAVVIYDRFIELAAELNELHDVPYNVMYVCNPAKVILYVCMTKPPYKLRYEATQPKSIQGLEDQFKVLRLTEDDCVQAQYIALTE